MKSPTIHYMNLEKSLRSLKIIVSKVDPIECKSDLQYFKLQSYILLSHAIFEEFLENLVRDVAQAARTKLKNDDEISKVLLGLVCSGILDEVEEKKANRKISEKLFRNIADFSATAHTAFLQLITENHGIKEENQKKLLLPIGIDPAMVDAATMAALHAFGTTRGSIAHNFKITREHTLSQVDGEIRQITLGLKNYDEAACGSLTTVMTTDA